MSYNYSSGNFSSCSPGACFGNPASSYESLYPSNVAYQMGPSPYGGCQENFFEPANFQPSYSGTRSFPASCFRRKNSIFCSPCQTNCAGPVAWGNTGYGSSGYGNTGFQSPGFGSSFCRPSPNFFSSRSYQPTCYQPSFGAPCFGSTY
ncbi:keratin-associated protein 15-1-like [Sorex fumeus]|uniref:keratin-associated protein 15-1-like n=1 Tax=Sorex fumeus TaxID=62283 RepID=UPI0024AE762D|nr:keratin-associated protein 15-1-like [Sorex fumeus]